MKKKVRITFRASVVIDGDSIEDIKNEFEYLNIFTDEARNVGAEFVEVISAEDADTFEPVDLTTEETIDDTPLF